MLLIRKITALVECYSSTSLLLARAYEQADFWGDLKMRMFFSDPPLLIIGLHTAQFLCYAANALCNVCSKALERHSVVVDGALEWHWVVDDGSVVDVDEASVVCDRALQQLQNGFVCQMNGFVALEVFRWDSMRFPGSQLMDLVEKVFEATQTKLKKVSGAWWTERDHINEFAGTSFPADISVNLHSFFSMLKWISPAWKGCAEKTYGQYRVRQV